ncbi:MAG: alkylmercury lyase family protein [Actinomycetota bacterium]|nr:alkylmercury lyase family protein [Actinomycetota bacterium]
MDEHDVRIRNFLYRRFVETGQAPRVAGVAREFGLSQEAAGAALRRLHDAHALVLEPDALEIRMLNPFSCVPSAWHVEAGGRKWYSNCAWDSFAICAALHGDGRIESSCADCGEPFVIEVRDRKAVQCDYVFHVLVPARQWWDDIVFT